MKTWYVSYYWVGKLEQNAPSKPSGYGSIEIEGNEFNLLEVKKGILEKENFGDLIILFFSEIPK